MHFFAPHQQQQALGSLRLPFLPPNNPRRNELKTANSGSQNRRRHARTHEIAWSLFFTLFLITSHSAMAEATKDLESETAEATKDLESETAEATKDLESETAEATKDLESTTAETPKKTNIIMVIWDDTRPDHLTPYGYERETTPTLAKIAKDATIFESVEAGGPWTMPSVASLFSGLFSFNHNLGWSAEDKGMLSPSIVTLAEALKQEGYTTGLVTAQAIFTKRHGMLQGFDTKLVRPTYLVLPEAYEFIRKNANRPYFLLLYWLDPHAPFTPPEKHDLWRDKSQPPINFMGGEGSINYWEVNNGKLTLTDAQFQQLRDRYDGELHLNDTFLGELWRKLQSLGVEDETLFVFSSDHGEAFNDTPRHKLFHILPYESVLKIPLIMRLPSKLPAKRIGARARNIDIYPTIMELVGGAPPKNINGKSLIPMIEGKETESRPNAGAVEKASFFSFERYTLLGINLSNVTTLELYDTVEDPMQSKDLSAKMPELASAIEEKHQKFLKENAIAIENSKEQPLGTEELERLKALGYIQ